VLSPEFAMREQGVVNMGNAQKFLIRSLFMGKRREKRVFILIVALFTCFAGKTVLWGQTANDYNNRGLSYFYNHDYNSAIAEFTQAIRLNPNYAEAYFNRGEAYRYRYALRYFSGNDCDLAIADYTQAIRLIPSYAEAYYRRGDAYSEKGDDNQAIADYEVALRINPNHKAARDGINYIRWKWW
jgi:tetratricopeptide (TPR) repeat protein